MSELPTLYRPTDRFKGEVKRLVIQGALVPVERCKHGLIDEHDSLVPKIDERGRKFDAIEWCDGSPTLVVTDDE